MKVLKWVVIVVFTFLYVTRGVVIAGEPAGKPCLGEEFVRQLWVNLKAANVAAVEKYIAPGFQSVHDDGARNREEELKIIKGLNMGEYTLSNFKVTRNGPVIVVTYFVAVEEAIEGKRLPAKPAARLSAWLHTESGWQWIIHANLNPLK